MLALGIDTTGAWCSVALVDAAKILAMQCKTMQRGHAEHLAPMVQELFKQTSTMPENLDRLVVCSGPGSFTGVRVGLSFAKGLALPHNIPVLGVSALEVWAAQADPEQETCILGCADIRRGQLMTQMFENGIAISSPELQAAEAPLPMADKAVGSGIDNGDNFVHPAILAWLGGEVDVKSHPPVPLYARAPDAKLPGGKALEVL